MRALKILILIPILLACQTLTPTPTGTPPPDTATPPGAVTDPDPPPTSTIPPSPTPTATLSLPTASPLEGISPTDFSVRLHPDGGLYTGDLVSFEVIAPPDVNLDDRQISIRINGETELDPAGFGSFGIGGRYQATLWWAWDTTGLPPGDYTLTYAIIPDGPSWTETLTLLPDTALPYPEPQAAWATAESNCCLFYYITGTAAARDIETLMQIADQQAENITQQFGGVELEEPITVVFVPRVLGQGGFAGSEIYISYLDRNYAGNAPGQVLSHEIVHILDGRLGGEFRPTLFVEGLAVYLSGGHFKKEPLMPRAAEALDLGWYLDLQPLADDFYPSQHEISYLEAASLIQYMVETWGWQAFSDFYRNIQPDPDHRQSAAIDQALQARFGLTFEQLETQFLDALAQLPDNPTLEDDVRLTVMFFDTVRRYQQAMDSSAYFLTAWLPDGPTMWERGIVADFVRHPAAPENIALETLLVNADADLRSGNYVQAEYALQAANAVLEAYEAGDTSPFYAHPLAADHLAVVLAVQAAGYTPQKIRIDGQQARVWANAGEEELVALMMQREETGWVLEE